MKMAAVNAFDYVVPIGTQQFTVLLLHNHRKEITPRANLRAFPNMARGCLMCFCYNRFLHYAGMFKPKLLCERTSYKEKFLRTMTYTLFIQSHLTLTQQCFPSVKSSSFFI
jgi:hypothetical protein